MCKKSVNSVLSRVRERDFVISLISFLLSQNFPQPSVLRAIMKEKLVLNFPLQRLDVTRRHLAFPSSSGYSPSDSVSYSDAWRHLFHLRHVRMLRQFSHPQTGVSGGLYVFKRWILPRYLFWSFPPYPTLTHFRWYSISGPFFTYHLLSFRLNVWIS